MGRTPTFCSSAAVVSSETGNLSALIVFLNKITWHVSRSPAAADTCPCVCVCACVCVCVCVCACVRVCSATARASQASACQRLFQEMYFPSAILIMHSSAALESHGSAPWCVYTPCPHRVSQDAMRRVGLDTMDACLFVLESSTSSSRFFFSSVV